MKRCYTGDYRFSEDLHFTLVKATSFEKILAELEMISAEVHKASGVIIRYSREDRKSHQTKKLVALTDRARNEPRDLYDVWHLTEMENMDLSALIPEIMAKLEFRGRGLDGMGEEFRKKEARLKKLWQMRLANQMAELPHFEEVFRSVQRTFRGVNLTGT